MLAWFINQVLRFFLQLGSAQCIKCMLGVVHKRCEAHRYIRVGGGYRHSYTYLKAVFDELEATLGHDPLNLGRLAAIHEACKLLDRILTLTNNLCLLCISRNSDSFPDHIGILQPYTRFHLNLFILVQNKILLCFSILKIVLQVELTSVLR